MSDGYGYDGEKAGDAWRKKVRGYWISTCPETKPILDFAGGMGSEDVSRELPVTEASPCRCMTELDVRRMSELIWGP